MSILTTQEAADMLRLDAADIYPQLDIILPAVDNFLLTATGKDWGADDEIDPTAKMVASVLLVRWFVDPGLVGKVNDDGVIGLISQLHAKALQEVTT